MNFYRYIHDDFKHETITIKLIEPSHLHIKPHGECISQASQLITSFHYVRLSN
jgi:hypothetical protein